MKERGRRRGGRDGGGKDKFWEEWVGVLCRDGGYVEETGREG